MYNFNIFAAFVFSFLVTYFVIPAIIEIARVKHLFDVPGERASHTTSIPTLGGLGIFIGFILSVTFWTNFTTYPNMQFIEFALVLTFFVGIKDDIIAMSPAKKAVGLLAASLVLTIWGNIRITSFYGIMGIYDLPIGISILFSIITIFGIINAFNLIDGINGLCASMALVALASLGAWFYLVGDPMSLQRVVVISALAGSLFAFLRYNFTPAKIFMGDTGSLIVGLLVAIFSIEFLEANKHYESSYHLVAASPLVAMSVIAVPLSDMIRVFFVRLINKKSPFYPDRSHIHHILLDLGCSHMRATGILVLISLSFVIAAFSLHWLGSNIMALIMIFMVALFYYIPSHLLKKKRQREAESNM